MKRVLFVLLMLGCVFSAFSQERKPVIGLDTVKFIADNNDSKTAAEKLESYLSAALVKSNRFTVVSRNAGDVDSLMQENLTQLGSLAQLKGLDFLLTAKIVDFTKDVKTVNVLGLGGSAQELVTIGLELKFLDVNDGRIVIQENIRETFEGDKAVATVAGSGTQAATDIIAIAMESLANKLTVKIVETVYPTLVLSVSNGIVTIPNVGFSVGELINVYKQGEEIIDPYTHQSLGKAEELVAVVAIGEVSGRVAKAVVPSGIKFKAYKDATIEAGYVCRRSGDSLSNAQIKRLEKQMK